MVGGEEGGGRERPYLGPFPLLHQHHRASASASAYSVHTALSLGSALFSLLAASGRYLLASVVLSALLFVWLGCDINWLSGCHTLFPTGGFSHPALR